MAMNGLHPVGDYLAVRDFLIKIIENPGLLTGSSNAGLGAVPDGNGGLPVGYGFDLISNSTRQVLIWVEGANASLPVDKRIVFTEDQLATLYKASADWSLLRRRTDSAAAQQRQQIAAVAAGALNEFRLADETVAAALLRVVAQQKEEGLQDIIQAVHFPPNSIERAVLASMAYQSFGWFEFRSGRETNLTKAIRTGDREAAWFHIRYSSIGWKPGASVDNVMPGLAKRRFAESELFGLYEYGTTAEDVSTQTAFDVYEMYTTNRPHILLYEQQFGGGQNGTSNKIIAANADYSIAGAPVSVNVQTLEASLDFAYRRLIADYAPARTDIDARDVLVASEVGQELVSRNRIGYLLTSDPTSNPYLLIGQGGNDRLIGGGGDDVLIGSDGDDILIGGEGDDVLDSGAGRGQVLDGGTGFDRYVVHADAVATSILDADMAGEITVLRLDGTSYTLGVTAATQWVAGSSAYRDALGNRFDLVGADLYVRLAEGGSLILRDYSTGEEGLIQASMLTASGSAVMSHESTTLNGQAGLGLTFQEASPYAPPPNALSYIVSPNDTPTPNASPSIGYYSGIDGWFSGGSYYDTLENEIITATSAVAGSGQTIYAPVRGGFGDSQITGDGGFNWLIDDVSWQTSAPYIGTYGLGADVGNDYLDGGSGADWLVTHGGDDEVHGGGDNDVIVDTHASWDKAPIAQGGAPVLYDYASTAWVEQAGHSSNDFLFGEDGNDYIAAHGGDQVLDGGTGNDELFGGAGNDTLVGGDGADVLSGDTRLSNTPFVLTGTLPSGAQTFEFNGDYLAGEQVKYGNDLLDGGLGNDTLFGGGGDDVLIGGAGDDRIQGDFIGASIYGDLRAGLRNQGSDALAIQGNDTIDGGAGADQIFGGAGDDVIDGGTENDIVYAGIGDDRVQGGAGADYLVGDDATGAQGSDELHGGDDADQVFGMGGDDRLYGDAGNDILVGGNGNDAVPSGSDTIDGGTGDDQLFGQDGNDVLNGGAGADMVDGGAGNDVLTGGGSTVGNDLLFGGAGNDRYVLNLGDGAVQITDTEGTNSLTFGSGVAADDVKVTRSGGLVFIDFSDADHAYMSDATFRQLGGFELADGTVLNAESIRHLFEPGTVSNGTLQLGAGVAATEVSYHGRNDDLVLSYSGSVPNWIDTSTLAARNVAFETGDGAAYGLAAGTQVLVLTNWYQSSPTGYVRELQEVGQPAVNFTTAAYAAARQFSGGIDSDLLSGSGGSDVILGNAGADILDGGLGNDDLTGGAGGDLLAGGSDNDTYRINPGDGVDLILDEAGTDDVVRFGPGITASSLVVTESASGLEVQVGPSVNGDSLLILNWSQGSAGSIDRFVFDDGSSLNRAQIDALNTGNHSPRLASTIGEQLARVGQAFTYVVPAGTFTDQDAGDTLTYTVTQSAGQPLPAWLSFNPTTRTFSGTPAAGDVGAVPIVLQATDSGGLTNTVEFDIRATGAVVLTGTSSANTLTASTAADHEIYGLGGNDTLTGNAGNDRLEGGAGDDALNAAAGSDTYVYARGDGSDTINQNDSSTGKVDTLLFRTGIVASDLVFDSETDGDLAIFVRNSDGTLPSSPSLTITGGLIAETNEKKLDRIIFEDEATVLTLAQIEQLAMTPTENADYLRGSSTVADTIAGLGGNDLIFGLAGNDTLNGGAGADTVDGGAGNDVLTGGLGNDSLTGGAGSDTYVVARGDGNDTIPATLDADPLSIDAVQFATGLLPGEVRVTRSGSTLSLRVLDPATGQEVSSVNVASGFDETLGSQILDEVRFVDAPGTVWTRADLQAKSLVGTASSETLIGFSTADVLLGNGGFDYLQGGGGNDELSGGADNDQLNGEAGDDTYRFGRGQGYDEILDSGGTNRILLDPGVLPGAVTLYRTSSLGILTSSQEATTFDDLVLVLDGGREQIRVEGFYNGQTPRPIASIEFTDGTIWDAAGIDARVVNLGGTANTQNGSNSNNTFTVDHPGDIVTDTNSLDNDTVNSRVSYTLPTNVEHLTLTDVFHINGTGNADNNTITGNVGDNVLQGMGEQDTLYGGGGNDTFLGFNDGYRDNFYGGTGDDTYYITIETALNNPFAEGHDYVNESVGEGYDVVYAQTFEYTMSANVEALIVQDVPGGWTGTYTQFDFIGNSLDNYIDARLADKQLTPNFLINGGAGADTMFVVNGGVNRVMVDNVGDVVNGADSNDTIVSSISYTLAAAVGNLELTGSGSITGTGNALGNLIAGSTSSGANVLTGGAGNDTYTIGTGDTVVENAGEGTDTVIAVFAAAGGNVHSLASYANVENLTVTDAAGAATLVGASGNNALTGNASANVLEGAGGDDTLTGGAGNDRYVGFGVGSGHDVVIDSAGTDRLEFDPSANVSISQVAISRTGNDLLLTRDAQSSVRVQSWFAAGGANVVESLVLQDAGLTYSYTGAQLEAAANGVNGGPALNAPVANQTLDLGVPYSFQLAANTFTDVESQSSLNYTATLIDGSALPAWLVFDAPSRTFTGTPTANDAAVLEVRVTATDGGGLAATEDFLLDVGHVRQLGTASGDALTGNASSNWIYGLEGHDTLDGQAGNDRLFGDAGDDSLLGGAGQDTLMGGRGSDALFGGADADQLQGGIGGDTYVFDASSGHDTIVESDGIDRIEFASGSGIVLSSLAASRTGDDLILTFGSNSVTIAGHYGSTASKVDEFVTYQAGVPYTYSAAQVEALVTGVNSAPYLAAPIRSLAARANVTWTYQVPANTFTDTQSQTALTYTARQAGGAALPSWLTFNASTRTLSGKPPNNTTADYAIEIVATDTLGLSTAAPFTLSVRTGLTTWTGTAAADTNAGTTGIDFQVGLGGNDTLSGNASNDLQDGGDGDDSLYGQAGHDTAYGGAGNDLLEGGDGDDSLYGELGRDTLYGGVGFDSLQGGPGADTLNGGIGNDALIGGDGEDVYLYASGDEQDTINNVSNDSETDRLQFTNVARAQLTFTRSGNNLEISRAGADRVTVTNWFTAAGNRIDEILTSDGQTTTADQVDALVAGGGGVFSSSIAEAPESEVMSEEGSTLTYLSPVIETSVETSATELILSDDSVVMPRGRRGGRREAGARSEGLRIKLRGQRLLLGSGNLAHLSKATDNPAGMERHAWIDRSLGQLITAMASFNDLGSAETADPHYRDHAWRRDELFGAASRVLGGVRQE